MGKLKNAGKVKLLLTFEIIFFAILLTQLSCKNNITDPIETNWELLGLEGKLVNDLKLIDNYLYACAGKDGLYRLDLNYSTKEWEYLGFADSLIERGLEIGITDIISINENLIVGYSASQDLNYNGIYLSNNNGKTWQPSDSGMITNPTSQIIRLKQYSQQSDIIFATTVAHLIYKSNNAGAVWEKIYGMVGGGAVHYAVNISNKNEIWIGGETGRFSPYLLISSDDGYSWSDYIWFPENFGPYFSDNAVYDIVIHPTDENTLYFGMLGVIGKTTDKGESFQRILGWDDGIYRYWRLEMNPNNPQEIFATGYYLYRTLNGGDSWEKIKPPFFEIYALAVNWQQRILYIIASSPENGIYKMQF